MDESRSVTEILQHLQAGEIHMDGYVPWGSNYTFIVTMTHEGVEMEAVYKPREGEQPLWDFPTGTLCSRERAAYLVSDWLKWDVIPPTILREGPQGWGSVQFFIDHDPEENFFTFRDDYGADLRLVALLDLIINNADRKGGHVIVGTDGRLWAIDHGIAFHDEPKLRTVIWDYVGEPFEADWVGRMEALQMELASGSELLPQLQELLSRRELQAMQNRLAKLLNQPIFPEPGPGRPYPWPLV